MDKFDDSYCHMFNMIMIDEIIYENLYTSFNIYISMNITDR